MITKNLRKVPAVKKYQTFDILIIYFHNEAKVFLNLKVGNSELESGKLICSCTLYGIGGDQEKLAEGSSCEKINILIICTMGPAKDTGFYQTITTTFCILK